MPEQVEDLEKQIKSLTREVKVLRKKLDRSETNRSLAETIKDETDTVYKAVLRQVQEQKAEIEAAQDKLNDAFSVITGSINYAARIQRSILPDNTNLEMLLPEHFILWHPRDTVGGDAYWHDVWGDGLFLMLGDCTGHGVPGAFMTLIASGALERAKGEIEPGKIGALVQRMHQFVQITLGQNMEGSESDDGMELGAVYLQGDMENMTFTGARSELFVVENGEVTTLKGTKKGIGYCAISFTQEYGEQIIPLREGMGIYLATDGMIDQIGGSKRRMFGKKRFRDLLLEIQDLPMPAQKIRLEQALVDYQGSEKRRDDVSVIGFRI